MRKEVCYDVADFEIAVTGMCLFENSEVNVVDAGEDLFAQGSVDIVTQFPKAHLFGMPGLDGCNLVFGCVERKRWLEPGIMWINPRVGAGLVQNNSIVDMERQYQAQVSTNSPTK